MNKKTYNGRLFVDFLVFILDNVKIQVLHKQSVVVEWAKEPHQASLLHT